MKVDPKNFINYNHTRKEEYGEFCYDDKKYSHPDRYKDCEHIRKDDIFGEIACFRCGLRFGSIFSTCEHRRKKRFLTTRIFIAVQIVNGEFGNTTGQTTATSK